MIKMQAILPLSVSRFFQRSELTATLYTFRREFLVVGIFSMVVNLLMLTPTLYMLQVYDRVLLSGSELTLVAMSLVALFFFGVMAVAEWARSRLMVAAGMRFDRQISTRVFNASFEARLGTTATGNSRAFSDLIQIRQFLTGPGLFAFFDAPWVPVYLLVLYVLNPWLCLMGCVFALIQAALARFGHQRTLQPTEESGQAAASANGYLQSKLRNAEVVESMGMLPDLVRRWNALHERYLGKSGSLQEQTHRLMAISKFIRYSQQSLSLGAGALLVIDGQLSAGGMIAANVLMTRALAPIDGLVGTWRGYLSARSAFGRVETLLAAHPERPEPAGREAPQGHYSLRNVAATAASGEIPILSSINLDIVPGVVTVVLGPSGSGKSTLGRVLAGIWPEVSGDVLLDGAPLQDWNRVDLGQYIGYLPQDIELLDGTVAENIARFGKVDADRVIEAARITGLHEMILRFPKGYDTGIGEGGGLLSGGQRQRIALARAIYGNPRMLILDEPNANLDELGEAALANAVKELKAQGKTVVVISHRGGIVAVADRLVVMKGGQIQMDGSKAQVLAAMAANTAKASKPTPLAAPSLPAIGST